MNARPKLRIAARDPGAANHLAGLLREPGLAELCDRDLWITGNVASYFEGLGLPTRVFDDIPTIAALTDAWRDDPADALLTGTSHYQPFDSLLWKVAAGFGAPSLAAVDFWSNLAVRFDHGRPGAIGVIDAAQAAEAGRAGLGPTVITGHPALAAIRPCPPRPGSDRLAVLFLSERIADDVAEGVNPPFGFDETDACRLVLAAARSAAAEGAKIDVTVKFHPYNDPTAFRARLGAVPGADGLTVSWIEGRVPVASLAADCDLVTGMGSIAMIEAALMGRPVISVQPNLIRENMFIPGVRGFADTLTDPADALARLGVLMRNPDERRHATERLGGFRESLGAAEPAPVARWMQAALAAPRHTLRTASQ